MVGSQECILPLSKQQGLRTNKVIYISCPSQPQNESCYIKLSESNQGSPGANWSGGIKLLQSQRQSSVWPTYLSTKVGIVAGSQMVNGSLCPNSLMLAGSDTPVSPTATGKGSTYPTHLSTNTGLTSFSTNTDSDIESTHWKHNSSSQGFQPLKRQVVSVSHLFLVLQFLPLGHTEARGLHIRDPRNPMEPICTLYYPLQQKWIYRDYITATK